MAGKRLAVGVIGPGLVGAAVVGQLVKQRDHIAFRRGTVVDVVAVANSSRMWLGGTALSAADNVKALLGGAEARSLDFTEFVRHLLASTGPRQCVVIDCTASETVPREYPAWIEAGVHVVTPNKKGFSSDISLFRQLKTSRGNALVLHEATVGAGLPVLGPLQDMLDSGDRVIMIEGILSGTLSFLFNSFSTPTGPSSRPFSDLVREAKELGFTEPDPRDDLNGMDFGRKMVILARLLGHETDTSTARIDSLVPDALRSVSTAAEFMARLPEADAHFDALNRAAFQAGEVLRYVGQVAQNGRVSVGIAQYPISHPFAGLSGGENVVSIKSDRYPVPLIIRGAGAGADVTAMGVVGDVLRIVDICASMQ